MTPDPIAAIRQEWLTRIAAGLKRHDDGHRSPQDDLFAWESVAYLLAAWDTHQTALRRLVEQWRNDARESSASGPELIYSDCASALAALLPPQAEP